MVLPQAMTWVQYWFRVLSLKFYGKSKKNCGDISQVYPAFCMYALCFFGHPVFFFWMYWLSGSWTMTPYWKSGSALLSKICQWQWCQRFCFCTHTTRVSLPLWINVCVVRQADQSVFWQKLSLSVWRVTELWVEVIQGLVSTARPCVWSQCHVVIM